MTRNGYSTAVPKTVAKAATTEIAANRTALRLCPDFCAETAAMLV
jgi:hypothetical protein